MNSNSSGWRKHPDYQIEIKLINKHIFIQINGEKIVDSSKVLLLCEQNHEPVYYFPRQDVKMLYMQKIEKQTTCPYKGEASHWSLKLQHTQIRIAAWSYEQPYEQVIDIKNHIAFYPEVMVFVNI
ncbi:MAG: DUF427 domain-containing protein [Thiohalomonadales bacterium]